MKKIGPVIFCLFVLPAFPLWGQEILQNSDFSDGTNHWRGDCKVAGADSTTDFVTPHTASGIMVELRSADWTKVTQEMRDVHKGISGSPLQLTITYQVSSDFKLSDRADDYKAAAGRVGFPQAELAGIPGQLFALVDCPPEARGADTGAGLTVIFYDKTAIARFMPSPDGTKTFTVNLTMPPLNGTDNPNFCLAIPPGHGSITITKISLIALK